MSDLTETYALVAVVRPNGQAMFHTQECDHAKRAISGLYVLPDDFSPGDRWCSRCLPGGPSLAPAEDNHPTTDTQQGERA